MWSPPTFTLAVAGTRASARSCLRHTKKEVRLIYLDTHMHCEAYKEGGICFRNHRRAESPRDPGPPGLVGTVGRRHRAPTANVAADCLEAPASPARGWFRRVD